MIMFSHDTLFMKATFVSKNNYYICKAKKED